MGTYILKNNQQTGPHEDADIRSGLASGSFLYSDQAWREGMAGWQPLSTLYPPPGPPPLSAPLPTGAPPPLGKFCSFCGNPLAWEAAICPKCGVPTTARREPAAPIGNSAGMRLLLPVGRSGWAIAAGYFGLFSLIVFPAPIALILSIIAIRDIAKSKSAEHPKYGMGRAIFGLIMGVLGTGLMIFFFIASRH